LFYRDVGDVRHRGHIRGGWRGSGADDRHDHGRGIRFTGHSRSFHHGGAPPREIYAAEPGACRAPAVAAKRFGVAEGEAVGACYTRTGRRFFDDDTLDRALLERISAALGGAGVWERFETDWVCLDAELLPWSAKAQGLLREQYAPVATAAHTAVDAALAATASAQDRGVEIGTELVRLRARRENSERYAAAYRAYCWETQGLEGVRIAPFHLLASEGKTYLHRPHTWHMEELARLAAVDSLFLATAYREVALDDPDACAAATDWWLELTGKGGEGMVVKPLDFVARGAKGLLQPAVKCRGREY
jgi:protein phosphatase